MITNKLLILVAYSLKANSFYINKKEFIKQFALLFKQFLKKVKGIREMWITK